MAGKVSIPSALKCSRQSVLAKSRLFDEAVERFRFEGKARLRANAGRASRRLAAFEAVLSEHVRLEEEKLFPYIVMRIPRFEILLYYFRTEHGEFRSQMQRLGLLLHLLVRGRSVDMPMSVLQEIRLGAMRLASHVAAHIHHEDSELFGALDSEFRADEKRVFQSLARGGVRKAARLPVAGRL